MNDFLKQMKVDTHVHINSTDPAFVEQARADNFRLLTINTDYPDFPHLETQQEIAMNAARKNPTVVAWATTFRMEGWGEVVWEEKTIRHLDQALAKGAAAVKVWKNIGMGFLDQHGRQVMIDDPGFDRIFSFLEQKNVPVIGHQGEPRNCWLPLAEMTTIYDKEYFRTHPQYHMYLHPELPSYEDQLRPRDRMLAKNRKLKFIGAHLASLEWSVDKIAAFLGRFPNAFVDLAARMCHLQFQSGKDREKVRRFCEKYQDRILYATDLMQFPDSDPAAFKTEAHEKWVSDWLYFTTDARMTAPELEESFRGLALPETVVEKFYRKNAERIFPGVWKL